MPKLAHFRTLFRIACLSALLSAGAVNLCADTYHLLSPTTGAVTPAGETLQTASTANSGFTPVKVMNATTDYWYGPLLTGSFGGGTWNLLIWTDQPGCASIITADVGYSDNDGSNYVSLGNQAIDVNASGLGNHITTFSFAIGFQTITTKRLRISLVRSGGGCNSQLAYNAGVDFDSRLITTAFGPFGTPTITQTFSPSPTITPTLEPALIKSVSDATPLLGDTITYTLAYKNPNPNNAVNCNDNFESGTSWPLGWSVPTGGTWALAADNGPTAGGSSALDAQETGGFHYSILQCANNVTDGSIQSDVKLMTVGGKVTQLWRQNGSSTYQFHVEEGTTANLSLRVITNGAFQELAVGNLSIPANSWFTMRFVVAGFTLQGYINGALVLSATDPNVTYNSGGAGVEIDDPGTTGMHARFDNVIISESSLAWYNTTMMDTLPTGLTYLSSTGGGSAAGQVVSFQLGTVTAQATGTRQIVARVDVCGSALVNTGVLAVGLPSQSFQSNSVTITPSCSSPTPTSTPSPSVTRTRTPTRTPTPSSTETSTATPTVTLSVSPSRSATPTASSTVTLTASSSATPSSTLTATPTSSATPTRTATSTSSVSPSSTPTATKTGTPSPSDTSTPTQTFSATPSSSATATRSATPSPTDTATTSPTLTSTATRTASATVTSTPTDSSTVTETIIASDTDTVTTSPTPTSSPSRTPTPSSSATPTATATSTTSLTSSASATTTSTPSGTQSSTQTPTSTASPSFSATASASATSTISPTFTGTPSSSATPTESLTASASPTFSVTLTATPSPTQSYSFTASPSRTASPTESVSPTASPSAVPYPFQVRAVIYNSAGEVVRRLYDGTYSRSGTGNRLSQSTMQAGQPGCYMVLDGFLADGSGQLPIDGRNDQGQPLGGGSYVIKWESTDPFGSVQTQQFNLLILPAEPLSRLGVFNSAGELVATLGLPVGLSDVSDFELNDGAVCVTGQGVNIAMRDSHGNAATQNWDGRSDFGTAVSSGSYMIRALGGSKQAQGKAWSVQVIQAPGSLADPVLAPNPVPATAKSFSLFLSLAPSPSGHLRLHNMAGEMVAEAQELTPGRIDVPLAGSAAGVYIASIEQVDALGQIHRWHKKVAILR